ncbi:MAG TPA: hypothetical protein VJ603_03395 [Paucimonas sp.]|nr:hypothetical protein [Paucimonas sp.]HJW54671.1 hypothetical protein [Burkholderiaceae bacterium]
MKLIALAVLALFFGYANAGWIDKQGVPLPDAEDRKAAGDFGAQLIFTADEQALFKKWATPSETVDLNTVESVAINQPISAFIVFSGCKPTAKGMCNVSMRFRVIQPDGKVYSETPAMEVWQNKPVPRARALELSVQYLKIVVEPHEQRGRYTIQAQVRDDNTGAVLSLQKAFTAVDAPSPKKHNPAVQGTLRDKTAQRP